MAARGNFKNRNGFGSRSDGRRFGILSRINRCANESAERVHRRLRSARRLCAEKRAEGLRDESRVDAQRRGDDAREGLLLETLKRSLDVCRAAPDSLFQRDLGRAEKRGKNEIIFGRAEGFKDLAQRMGNGNG